MQKKGISPLIAVIVLIAITLIIAGVLASWATQFAQQQRRMFEQCINARMVIRSIGYNNDTGQLMIGVHNLGSIPLTLVTIIEYQNGTLYKLENATSIGVGDVKNIYVDTPSNIKEVTMQSQECAGVADFFTRENIEGL